MTKLKPWNDHDPIRWKSVWRENHGTFLLVWSFVVLLGGLAVIVFRQNRFVPPRFPDAQAIGRPEEEAAVADRVREQDAATIRVTGATSDRGMVRIAVHELSGTYPQFEEAFLRVVLDIEDGEAVWTVPLTGLPESFALSAFHDENNDGRLNRDPQGSPQESIAYSNEREDDDVPRPSFEQAVISRPRPGETIELRLR